MPPKLLKLRAGSCVLVPRRVLNRALFVFTTWPTRMASSCDRRGEVAAQAQAGNAAEWT